MTAARSSEVARPLDPAHPLSLPVVLTVLVLAVSALVLPASRADAAAPAARAGDAPLTASVDAATTSRAAPAGHGTSQRAAQRIARQRGKAVKLLNLVNSARARGRTCGSTYYPAAKPLKYRTTLATAARRHARDMAAHNYFDHYGRSGSTPTSRARAAGYKGGTGENIAAGYGSASRTMSAWLQSPGHCANIMSRSYKHLGIGYAYDASSTYRDYWVQDFGTG